jgi:carboxypeptidase D
LNVFCFILILVQTWEDGTLGPVQNSYSWTNLTNVVWIEQPVGVGYSTGVPNISNEKELGLEFIGFWKNFVDTFETHKYKTYVTGESYAGMYVPYIVRIWRLAQNEALTEWRG